MASKAEMRKIKKKTQFKIIIYETENVKHSWSEKSPHLKLKDLLKNLK